MGESSGTGKSGTLGRTALRKCNLVAHSSTNATDCSGTDGNLKFPSAIESCSSFIARQTRFCVASFCWLQRQFQWIEHVKGAASTLRAVLHIRANACRKNPILDLTDETHVSRKNELHVAAAQSYRASHERSLPLELRFRCRNKVCRDTGSLVLRQY
jgi:hypothetical protein